MIDVLFIRKVCNKEDKHAWYVKVSELPVMPNIGFVIEIENESIVRSLIVESIRLRENSKTRMPEITLEPDTRHYKGTDFDYLCKKMEELGFERSK